MANEEQLAILKQGVDMWNKWREENPDVKINLIQANLVKANLRRANLCKAELQGSNLWRADLYRANLGEVNLGGAILSEANFKKAILNEANLSNVSLDDANFSYANLHKTNLHGAMLHGANLWKANLTGSNFLKANVNNTIFGNLDLSKSIRLDGVVHSGPSTVSTDTFTLSKGKIPEVFLRGCGLSDWEIEQVKLYDPDLSNDEFVDIQNRIFDLRNRQAIQISPLFISYSHGDDSFVNKLESQLSAKGIRFWRDIHDLRAGRIEKQIDRAISQNRTVLLVLSENSLRSDWVEHEVRTARGLEKEMERDALCPVALDDSWKNSHWPKRVMEQIMEYNILDFSAWRNDSKFDNMFRRLIDGLELFYKA